MVPFSRETAHIKKGFREALIGFLIIAIFAPFIALPRIADAQATEFGAKCAGGLLDTAIGYGIGLGKAALHVTANETALTAEKFLSVPTTRLLEDTVKEDGPAGQGLKDSAQFGAFWEVLQEKFRTYCLNGLWQAIAKTIIRAMRNMVINYINTGNFGQPTFVANFQFDARQTAENAARIFASKLTGIDFCNYFPRNPANLNLSLDIRAGLACTYQKSFPQYLAAIHAPGDLPLREQILLDSPENDPLWVDLDKQLKLSNEVAAAKRARETQVISGKGFIGTEKCVKEEVVVQGGYFHSTSGERCQGPNDPPGDCIPQAPQTVCVEKKIVTPGSYIADLATEPIKSEFREGELVDEFGEAIAQIVDSLVGKLINQGLDNIFKQ
ncbi:MAG: hypothetical protein HYT40_00020 [Candidatus Sungbacteria bacterium]|uniref:Uncharacterized protein n=1 Tax=Candidatus Sungiibacteriota bacterium TaxID=2750080 RepID=A0A931SD73_9BACT|nr:hypothetical protein [Candidatus Sungbacteria bacterium]